MFIKISHRGLNSRKEASQLHDMISEGYKKRFQKKLEEKVEIDPDKKMFVDALNDKEIDFLVGGFTHA